MSDNETITEEQAEEMVRQFSEGKSNLHSFFRDVVKAKDTTKTGNLTQEELGMPQLPVRTYKELALFCNDVAGQEYFSQYFDKMSEIQTSSSLSKEALLMKLAVTIKKELADTTPQKKKNKGWFSKKDDKQDNN